jgi:hypothetical protein
MAILGPDTPRAGVVTTGVVTQNQVAATVAALLGKDYGRFAPRAGQPLEVLRPRR